MKSTFFENAFKLFPDAIIVVDVDGLVRYVNNTMLDLFEYQNEDQVIGKGIWELSATYQDEYHQEAKEASLRMIKKADRRGYNQFDWQHAKQGKSAFHAEVSLRKIVHEKEALFISSVRDISNQKQLEQKLIAVTHSAEESAKQKLDFLANMSHEIRSPLNVIIGFSELLEFTDISGDEHREYAGIIRTNGALLQRLIDDIIDVSKIETNKLKVVKTNFNVNELLTEIFQSFSLNGGSSEVEMKLNIPKNQEKLTLHADPYRLKQILTNLITNAKKFTTQGEINIGYKVLQKDTIEFYVEDTGKGISEDDLKLIFSRFEQGSSIDINEIKGFGLGLAISRGLTYIMGGKINVESELHKGSKFMVSFPLKEGADQQPEKKQAKGIDLSGIQILIAEDVYENFEFLNALFKRTNASITWAKNGQEAVEYVKNEPFDLVLMDIKMPKMTGYEALEVIRKTHISLPIIAQTAYALDFDRSKGLAAGFNDYISKPIKVDELFEKIGDLLKIKAIGKQ